MILGLSIFLKKKKKKFQVIKLRNSRLKLKNIGTKATKLKMYIKRLKAI